MSSSSARPGGIFAALELVRRNGSRVLLVERGPDIAAVLVRRRDRRLRRCEPCGITAAGAAPELSRRQVPSRRRSAAGSTVSSARSASSADRYATASGASTALQKRCTAADEESTGSARGVAARHDFLGVAGSPMGTERPTTLRDASELEEQISVLTGWPWSASWREPAARDELRATSVVLADGSRLTADAVVVAPGPCRRRLARRRLQAPAHRPAHQPGRQRCARRVPAAIMEPLTSATYEPRSSTTRRASTTLRTSCMNPYGTAPPPPTHPPRSRTMNVSP